MWIAEYLWRQLTDKPVWCQKCLTQIGYMTRKGHMGWWCERCSDTGRMQAVDRAGHVGHWRVYVRRQPFIRWHGLPRIHLVICQPQRERPTHRWCIGPVYVFIEEAVGYSYNAPLSKAGR